MTKRRIGIFLLTVFATITINAQVQEGVLPYSASENLDKISHFVEMADFDKAAFENELKTKNSGEWKSSRFAKSFTTNLNPNNSGEWLVTPKGRVWRLGICSKKAYSIYLTFKSFQLSEGVCLFIYSPGYRNFLGAFTHKNNNSQFSLSVPPVEGDSVIVELNVPFTETNYGLLNISKVHHDCLNEFGKRNTTTLKSGNTSCFEDINCVNGTYWQTEKRAVCKIVCDGQLSTGTLVGNTSATKMPYVITARHTMFDSIHAAEAVFFFNYETAGCNGETTTEYQTISGSSFIASAEDKLDYTLVKLNSVPPSSFRPYYAGWDARNTVPLQGTCIHHPWGTEKQIAIEYHPPRTSSFGQNYDPMAFWNVQHWDIGTTEPGSSGSPLFNKDHRLVGTLTGGSASCSNPVNDFFSQFCLAWDKYPEPKTSLQSWLDPENKGWKYMDGYDPYGFNAVNCDTAWNYSGTDKLTLKSIGFDWGWISGHNSAMATQFAEKFTSSSTIQIPGVFLNVAKAYSAQPLSVIRVKVWEGNTAPLTEIYSKPVFIKNLKQNEINYIGFDSIVKVAGNFFIGYEIYYGSPMDTFAVFHTSKLANRAASSMYAYNGMWLNVKNIGAVSLSASLGIGITECYGRIGKLLDNTFSIYPNPCNNQCTIDIPTENTINAINCYTVSGRQMPVKILYSVESKKIHFDLPQGLYLLKVYTDKGTYVAKMIVLGVN